MSVASLRARDEDAVVWVANDAAAPIPDADLPPLVKVLRTEYARGGTGAGLEAVRGQLEVFRHVLEAEKAEHVVKIDGYLCVPALGGV